MRTYCVIIHRPKVFNELSKTATCFFRKGIRGVLVSAHEPKGLTIVRTLNGNHSKDPEVMAWSQSNLVEDLKAGPPTTARVQARAIQRWLQAQDEVEDLMKRLADAVKAEEDARMGLGKALQGAPCVINGKPYYPMPSTNKEGDEVIHYFRNSGPWQLDTV